jgi:DNA-directed RNA polymerase subunit L
MNATVTKSSSKEINLSIKESDIGTLYIVQHELLKDKTVDFAGLILKHPLTNECWMRINSSKGNPLNEIIKATDSALESVNELKKIFNSKIKVH